MAIYWFTGQPGHGKTVLADKLQEFLSSYKGISTFRVDGDDLRALTVNKDYSKEGRLKNVKSAQDIALFLHNKGHHVTVSLVSPYRDQREEFKKLVGADLMEFYVHTTEIRGREQFHVEDYEPPLENFYDVDTTDKSPLNSLLWIVEHLHFLNKLP